VPREAFANGVTRGGGVPPPCHAKLCSPISSCTHREETAFT
jgi:hypothetical protein